MHFAMVALYGVGRLLFPRPSVNGVFSSVALIYTAACLIVPIIKAEGIRAVFFPMLAGKPSPSADMRRAAESSGRNLVGLK